MTLAEKQQKIEEFCENFNGDCTDCPMYGIVMNPLGGHDLCYSEGADIERNYAYLFGTDQVKFEHDGCNGCKHNPKENNEFPCNHCRGTVLQSNPLYYKCADLYEPEKPENTYWERICKLADKQRAKGIETYGQGLEMNPADMLKRIEHLQEELIDGLMYCEWIKDKLKELES